MRRVMILGNCVAERLQTLLSAYSSRSARFACPALQKAWEIVPAPMIHRVAVGPETDALAAHALRCDLVFTQPLFHYGACNTENLRLTLPPERLVLFSAPNFEAYFPDVMHLPAPRTAGEEEAFPPPLEWHSRIMLGCYTAGVPAADVESLYVRHALFRAPAVQEALDKSWVNYSLREQGVELGTLPMVQEQYASAPLFHTWNHPGGAILRCLCAGMLHRLGVENAQALAAELCAEQGFGFNQWPIITRHHKLFTFAERAYFTVAGQRVSIGDVAEGYYNYYRFHPHWVEAWLRGFHSS